MRLETCVIVLLGVALCSPHEINVWNNIQSKVNGIRGKITSAVKNALGVKKGNGEYPEFCNNLKCPKFTTISKGDGYEERCYDESTWVMTSMQVPHKQATPFKPMFGKLAKYINGENDQKVKIAMTAPVLVTVEMSQDKNNSLDVQMHFFVSPTNLTVPKPTGDKVTLISYPKICVYVRVFRGFQMGIDKKLVYQRNLLTKALDKVGLQYEKGALFYAGYDSPWKLYNRHNEVMVQVVSPTVQPNEANPQILQSNVVV